jgi:hypothetical protein
MRWTGSSGHIVEHQPLLPFRNMPPTNPPVIAPRSSSALNGPLSSSPSLRSATNATKRLIAIT